MKRKIYFLVAFFFTSTLCSQFILAQSPPGIPYQAIARDNTGSPLVNQSVALRISIRNTSANGTIIYQETQNTNTTNLGLLNLTIGLGTPVTGALAAIDWGNGAKFIEVEMDPAGGTAYTSMGTTQLMSVPYALFATRAANLPNGSTNGNTLRWDGTTWVADNTLFNNGTQIGIGTSTPGSKLTVLQPNANASELLSGNSAAWTGLGIGRTASEYTLGVACSTNNLMNGSVAGDAVLRIIDTNKKLLLGPGTATPALTISSNRVGIGTTNPSVRLDVVGSVKITDGTQAAGRFLTSDANGNASWATIPAGGLGVGTAAGNTPFWNGTSWITNNNNVFNNGGNVGIGTTTPVSKLTVAGQVRATTSGYGFEQNDGVVSMGTYTNGVSGWIGTNSNHPLYFYTANGNESMAINTSGNVGIGTNNPVAKLHVNGEIRTTQEGNSMALIGTNNANTGVGILFSKQAVNAYWYAHLGVAGGMFTLNSLTPDLFKVDLQNAGASISRGLFTPRLAVNSSLNDLVNDAPWYGVGYSNLTLPNQSWPATQVSGYWGLNFVDRGGNMVFSLGKLGIGTNNPVAKLHVTTSSTSQNAIVSSLVNANTQDPGFALVTATGQTQVGNYGALVTQIGLNYGTGSDLSSTIRFHRGSTTNDGFMSFSTNQNTERLRIHGSGSVSIGTTTASSGYLLTVAGKVICTELRVQAMPFPDYVFAPDYKLATLEEVEAHIKEKQRLPNMPPASEVEAGGMDVGKFELKLVEKIEELTLYLIQQQKEIDALKQQLSNTSK